MSKIKKTIMQCTNCQRKYKVDNPSIIIRHCKGCNQETEFERFKKETPKPFISKQKTFTVMCTYCQRVQTISKQCCWCGQRFNRRGEAETITDIILNILTGGGDKGLGYIRVTVDKFGMPWWTAPKDSSDYDDPFLANVGKQGSSSYQGQGEFARSDDITPVQYQQATTTGKRRFIK